VTSYDAELQRHNEVLRQACGVQFRDHVLDIGCGSGQTTREAARAARAGSALGVDVFDVAISRFGTMFFDDPAAAFANVSQALRPAGRLVMMVWQAPERNEWDVTIRQSLGAAEGPVVLPSGLPDPFSLADPPAVTEILEGARFADITFTDVSEPVYYGPDVDAAMDWVRGFAYTREILRQLDPTAAERAVGRLREALAAHFSDDGVWFNSRAWIVTTRRR
jgi:SAM-dependent methyltransferase